ncbi:hypothetical protein ACFPM7_18805 [Actinokineospora guangxiensis]|uniref:Uncharacterized protein n=1 Tax=Actinokineospora guangxiensis TaxID=1490288 RepID=A0ABW0ES79_9PSEU
MGTPDDDAHGGPSRTRGTDGPTVSLDELLVLGETHYLAPVSPDPRSTRLRWLRRAEAITTAPSRRPGLAAATAVPAIALLLWFINQLAPQAMPEVCSTLVLLVVTEFVLVVRQRRALAAVAG